MSCQHGNWDGACGICEELDRQYELGKASARKEIERLTAERDDVTAMYNRCVDDVHAARAERNALRSLLADLRTRIDGFWDEGPYEEGWCSDELEALKAKVDIAITGEVK